jgi:Arc-like DNA binding domain
MAQGARRGRPPKSKTGEAKRASFNTRLREGLKVALETSAAENGRSLSEEIESRLEMSLAEENALGGPRVAALLRTLVVMIEDYGDDSWLFDADAFNETIDRWNRFFDTIRPARADSDVERISSEFEAFKLLMESNPGSEILREYALRNSMVATMDPEWRARWAALAAEPDEDKE